MTSRHEGPQIREIHAQAIAAERLRIRAILDLGDAQNHATLAKHLALQTQVSASAAAEILAGDSRHPSVDDKARSDPKNADSFVSFARRIGLLGFGK